MVKLRLSLFFTAIVAKLWLIWESEIADAIDDPHEYVLQILYPINGGLSYPPGTGLVGQLFRELGVSFRFGIEITFLIATALVIRALFAWPWKSWLPLGLFIFTIFDPATAELFSHIFSDQVWLIETMLGSALLALALRQEGKIDWNLLLASLLFLCLTTITRSVVIPLLMAVMVFALLSLGMALAKYRSKKLKRTLDLLALTVPTLIFGILLIYGCVCRYNFVRHGYSGISYLDSAEYKKFYLTLQSVGDPTGPAHFPIDENRRKLIALAGSDSNWFVQQIEANDLYKQPGVKFYDNFDIPAGWFHWAAFSATTSNGHYMNSFALFKSIEDEIATANQAGRIKVRSILPLPDSRLPIVLRVLPGGFLHTITQLDFEPPPDAFIWKSRRPHYLNLDFDKALTRRIVAPSPLREEIWHGLTLFYSFLYTPAFILYLITLFLFKGVLLWRWKQIEAFSPLFIAQQFFSVLFIVLIFWYAFFDASGMPAMNRYMIFNHVALPLLICYYLINSRRLWRKHQLP